MAETLLDDLGLDRDPFDGRATDLDRATVVGEKKGTERHLRPCGTDELFDAKGLTLCDAILFST